jgi:hypothetical protein
MTPRGADIEVTFRLLMGNDSAGALGEQRVRVTFTRQDDAWLIDRWQRLEP